MNTILVVVSNTRSLNFLKSMLEREEFIIKLAYEGEGALNELKRDDSIDLVLTAEQLDDMCGQELFGLTHSQLKNKIPFILLSRSMDEEEITDLKMLGFYLVLCRLVSTRRIIESLRLVLA